MRSVSGILFCFHALPVLWAALLEDYTSNPTMSGMTCEDKTFTKQNISSPIKCAGICCMNEDCVSFAYSETMGKCDGCGLVYKNTVSLSEVMHGGAYFTPTRKTGYQYVGCVSSPPGATLMSTHFNYIDELTAEKCSELCKQRDLPYFGMEYGLHCRCGDEFYNHDGLSTGCTMACPGNNTQVCGGHESISAYKYTYVC